MNGRVGLPAWRTPREQWRSTTGARALWLLTPSFLALIGFAVAGRAGAGLLVALGASVALVGARRAVAGRVLGPVAAAGVLLLAVWAGYDVADVFLTLILWNLILAVVATAVDLALSLGPLGPWPFVLMVDVGSLLGMNHVGLADSLRGVALGCLIGLAWVAVAAWWTGRAADPDPAAWPTMSSGRVWPVVASFLEGYIAVLLTSVFPHATRDRHPFWPVLVVVVVLTRSGLRGRATRRGLRCLAGALLAVLVFAALSRTHPSGALLVLLVVLLGGLAALLAARHDLAGGFVVALLGLVVTQPLLPPLSVPDLLVQHGVDALVAAALALLMIRLLRPACPAHDAAPREESA